MQRGAALAASFDVSVNNDDGSGGTSGTSSWAIRQANLAGPVSHSVTLKSDVTLTARMRQLIEQSVTIQADNSARQITCNAGSGGQPFFIGGGLAGSTTSGVSYPALSALNVTLKGLTLSGCSAKGGDSRAATGGISFSFSSNSASNGQPNYYWSAHPTALDSYLYACDTKVSSIAIDPISASIVYSGLDGAGVFKSSNSGNNWLDANGSSPNNLGNLRVKALLIKPGSNGTLFAATYGGGVFKSVNSASAWSACDTASLGNLNVLSLAMNSSATKLYAGTETGVYVSSNDCTSWAAMNTGFPQ